MAEGTEGAGRDLDPYAITLGRRFRQVREQARASQTDVARAIGRRRLYVLRCEAGVQSFRANELMRAAEFLGVAPALLLEIDEDGEPVNLDPVSR